MKTIIKEIRGDAFNVKNECVFCLNTGQYIFGFITEKKADGLLFNNFNMCENHFNKLNTMLSGDFDIDKINTDQYKKKHSNSGIRMRS